MLVDHKMARHSRAALHQQLEKWDGIGMGMAWHRPSPTTDRTELRPVRWALAWAVWVAAPCPKLPSQCLGPCSCVGWSSPPPPSPQGSTASSVIAWCTQIRSGVSGNKTPERCLRIVGLRADSEGRRSNFTPQWTHDMTAIGQGVNDLSSDSHTVLGLVAIPQAFAGFWWCLHA